MLEVLEALEKIPAPTMDMHRAIAVLMERLASLDALNQRYEACTDPELRLVLAHHRDADRQQIAMLLEWMRRRDSKLDVALRDALFKAGPITAKYKSEE